jgi:outer membrane biosynthesis protein TonB
MQEDLKLRQEITTRNLNLVASRSKEESTEIEEPEVGWGNYNTYIQNNIKVPTDIRNKNTGREVELSFLVDNKGDPTDIRITKSLCNECDKEAIRLLKEGPKWKRKGKRGNTRVSIVVDRN